MGRVLMAGAMAVVVSVGSHGLARGQTIDPGTTFNPNNTEAGTFNRGENVSVRDRPRPDYQAAGLHLGGFIVYPKITTSIGYDDNIYALHTGAVGDEIFTLAPEIDVQSTWSRNALSGYVRAAQDVYAKYADEDTTQYGLGASGKYQFGDAAAGEAVLTGGVDFGRYALPRSAANSGSNGSLGAISKHPIQYDFTALNAELADTFNRLRISGRIDYQIYDYFNGETAAGAQVFEQNLNHGVATFTGKAEYAVSPDTAVFLAAAYNDREYQLRPPSVAYNSNSQGYNIAGGANFDITHLVRGEVQIGYMDQHYVSSLFPEIAGLSAKAQVEWFPTQLTTVTATALRAVGDSGIIGSAGYLNTTGGIQVDHELLRNLILTANAVATQNQYEGISRTDTIFGVGASANWLLTRAVGLTLAYTYTDQQSSGSDKGPSFGDNRISLTAVFQY
jgi:hypothetical protein